MQFKLLIVEDDLSLGEALSETLSLAGYQTEIAENGEVALVMLQNKRFDLVISDVQMARMDGMKLLSRIKSTHSELPIMLMTAHGSIEQAVQALHSGAVDYLVKPFQPEVVVSKVSQYLPAVLSDNSSGFIAVDEQTKAIVELANKVADSDATLLITGESGTGKEVLAQYVHQQSNRKDKPFVAINCAAIPENMLEAMLFGYQKGAYTGAYKSCPGKFEQAQDGTLLLDEISEMSLPLQAKLLRVLQERVVERLGDQNEIQLNVRVIATSNRNMRKEIEQGKFREDLFYRLNVFPVTMPALRERKADILPITNFLLACAANQSNIVVPKLSSQAETVLADYSWPGNVRELDNVMQRALILHSDDVINADDIRFEQQHSSESGAEIQMIEADGKLGEGIKQHEQNIILETLKETMGSKKTAAEKLGISPRTLRYKLARMREQGITIPA